MCSIVFWGGGAGGICSGARHPIQKMEWNNNSVMVHACRGYIPLACAARTVLTHQDIYTSNNHFDYTVVKWFGSMETLNVSAPCTCYCARNQYLAS